MAAVGGAAAATATTAGVMAVDGAAAGEADTMTGAITTAAGTTATAATSSRSRTPASRAGSTPAACGLSRGRAATTRSALPPPRSRTGCSPCRWVTAPAPIGATGNRCRDRRARRLRSGPRPRRTGSICWRHRESRRGHGCSGAGGCGATAGLRFLMCRAYYITSCRMRC